ncbi:MAG: hypothetical protein LC777_04370 [Actinobacteria bacterium]|nr:hypothetical protein [Actinomycetota bacterium]
MGTSGAYGGSGGRAWGKAREQAGEYATNPTPDNAQQLLSDIADALDWDGDVGGPQPLAAQPRLRGTPGGGGDGPGGGGGGRGGGGLNQGGSGRSRSRSQAAAVGGSVAAAGLALRDRDGDALQRYGLTLAELDGLDPHEQARRILGSPGVIVGEDHLSESS